ncbi:alpha-tocopherol transfer protein isoform X1 [Diabrotica virgifera virgifera]|uniref:Alpha-tocopherol transfer protein-like isoform X1 n=2 Tax=Diabrotica virgifera virgifera TaxID=50390 RepID=A0A6P7EXT6_DIAVI|nr:alpha-tocopherol transfer protein isoform X1 [Diabrotica virgifera virgifera]
MREVELKIQCMSHPSLESPQKKETTFKGTFDLEEPSQELLQWAKENINEDPDTRDLLISELKDMIYERGECTPTRTDDEFLLRFLRARHFILKKAHRLYVNYHNFIQEAPEYFKNVNLQKLTEIKKTKMFNCPLSRDQSGRRMLIYNIGEWVPSDFSPTELIQFVIFLIQISMLEQKTQINGVVALFDLSGLSLEMVWYMSPTLAKHMVNIATTSMPCRLEGVHFLYSSWMFDTAFSMVKGLVSPTVTDRIHFHNDLETLYSHIDPKYLPNSLGGAQEDYSLESWYNDILETHGETVKTELESLGYPVKEFLDSIGTK